MNKEEIQKVIDGLSEFSEQLQSILAGTGQQEAERTPAPWRPPEGKGSLNQIGVWYPQSVHTQSAWNICVVKGLTYDNKAEARRWQALTDWTTRYFALARYCNAKHEPDGQFYGAYYNMSSWTYDPIGIVFDIKCVFTSKAAVEEAVEIMNADPEYWKLPRIGGEG